MTQPLHVLLVDAQPPGGDSLEQRLKRSGYRTTLARTHESALETAESDPPDLIVLDLNTPALDGPGTCRELKRLKPQLPVIVYTRQSELPANECGADELIAKPADPALVMQKIVQLLRR